LAVRTVLICAVQTPFITGGAEILVAELRENLLRRGFKVDVANVPFKWYPVSEIIRQALAWRLLDVTESNGTPVDLVIPTKFPSYLVQHPSKVTWLFHQHREVYDLYGGPFCSFEKTPEHDRIREAIQVMDTRGLSESRAIFTISQNVANRLERYNGLGAAALYPPPQHLGLYRTDGYGDYLFSVGRLERLKRFDLAIDALARCGPDVRLKIAGTGPVESELRRQVERLGIEDRVELLGFVSLEDLIALYAGCRAVLFAPLNEDYGYVTIEAFLSRKPVITTYDAGGPLEFVTDGVNGWVAAAEADRLAETIQGMWNNSPAALRAMGEEGCAGASRITWDSVVDRLVGAVA
jgi:glycosyltransferase involved in cell wall biosynthesis